MNESAAEKIQSIETPEGTFIVRLILDDLGSIYPGMIRYTVEVLHGTETVYTYAINSYEAPPGSLFDTREVAEIVFSRLAHDVASRPHIYTHPRLFTRPLPGGGTAYKVCQNRGSGMVTIVKKVRSAITMVIHEGGSGS